MKKQYCSLHVDQQVIGLFLKSKVKEESEQDEQKDQRPSLFCLSCLSQKNSNKPQKTSNQIILFDDLFNKPIFEENVQLYQNSIESAFLENHSISKKIEIYSDEYELVGEQLSYLLKTQLYKVKIKLLNLVALSNKNQASHIGELSQTLDKFRDALLKSLLCQNPKQRNNTIIQDIEKFHLFDRKLKKILKIKESLSDFQEEFNLKQKNIIDDFKQFYSSAYSNNIFVKSQNFQDQSVMSIKNNLLEFENKGIMYTGFPLINCLLTLKINVQWKNKNGCFCIGLIDEKDKDQFAGQPDHNDYVMNCDHWYCIQCTGYDNSGGMASRGQTRLSESLNQESKQTFIISINLSKSIFKMYSEDQQASIEQSTDLSLANQQFRLFLYNHSASNSIKFTVTQIDYSI